MLAEVVTPNVMIGAGTTVSTVAFAARQIEARGAANAGSKAIAWTGRDPAFRTKLAKAIGDAPVGDFDAHHVLPVEFGQDFARLGLDANAPQFGTWVARTEHQRWSSEFAKDWGSFLRGSPNEAQVLDFARMMGGKYGFDVHF